MGAREPKAKEHLEANQMQINADKFLRIDLQLCCLADIGEFLAWSLHSVQCSLPLKGRETEHLRNSTGPIWHWPWTLEAALTWLHDISRRSLQEAKKARKDTFHLTSESSIPRKFPRFFPDQVAQVETGHVKERIAIGLCFWHPPSLVVCKQHWNYQIYQMNFRWIGSIIPVRSIRSEGLGMGDLPGQFGPRPANNMVHVFLVLSPSPCSKLTHIYKRSCLKIRYSNYSQNSPELMNILHHIKAELFTIWKRVVSRSCHLYPNSALFCCEAFLSHYQWHCGSLPPTEMLKKFVASWMAPMVLLWRVVTGIALPWSHQQQHLRSIEAVQGCGRRSIKCWYRYWTKAPVLWAV